MADLEKTVSILFKGVDEVSSSVNSISSSFDKFNSKVISATQPLADIAMGAEKLQAALVVMAVGGMALAVTEAGKFHSGLMEIHTLVRATPEELEKFDASIEAYAATSTQSLDDINKAVYQAISANVDYKEAVGFVSDAEKLAVAGKSTLTEAVDLLTNTLSAYGAGMDEAGAYSDVFFKAVEIGKLTVPELSKSISLVSPIASATGVSIQEVSAALAALTAGGLPASTSAEYLRGALQDMVKPTKEAQEQFAALGIEFGASELSSKGFAEKMKEIWEKTGGSSDAIAKLFGNVGALTAVLVLGKDSSGLYAKALDDLANASGSVDRSYAIMSNNIEYTNQRLVNSFKFALVEAGKPMLDDWGAIALGLGEIFAGIKIGLSKGAFDEVFSAIDSFAEDAGKYFSDVAAALPEAMAAVDFTEFLSSITGLGGAVGELLDSLFGDLDLTKPEDLANAIQKVVDAVTKLNEFTTGIAESLNPFFSQIGVWINKALEADTSTVKLAGNTAGLGQAVNAAATAIGMLAPALSIFSGALVVDAIATIGKLGTTVGLAAGPLGWAVLAAAAIGGLYYELTQLDPASVRAAFSLGALDKMFEDVPDNISGASEAANEFEREMQRVHLMPEIKTFTINAETGESTEKINTLNTAILSFPADFSIDVKATTGDSVKDLELLQARIKEIPPQSLVEVLANAREVDDAITKIQGIPALSELTIKAKMESDSAIDKLMSASWMEPVTVSVSTSLDESSVEKTYKGMEKVIKPDGTITWVSTDVKQSSLDATNKKLDDAIPKQKEIEIKIQGDIDKELAIIKASAETVQAALEWTAKVNIATVEADAERMKAAFVSAASELSDLTKLTADILALDWDEMGISQYMAASDAAAQTLKLTKEAHDANMKLLASQAEYEQAKLIRMQSGKALITINSEGLEPALEMIMWQIIEKVKIRANEESAQFLLGIA